MTLRHGQFLAILVLSWIVIFIVPPLFTAEASAAGGAVLGNATVSNGYEGLQESIYQLELAQESLAARVTGDAVYGGTDEWLPKGVRVQVWEVVTPASEGIEVVRRPAVGVWVRFTPLLFPDKGSPLRLSPEVSRTDAQGFVSTRVRTGVMAGLHILGATVVASPEANHAGPREGSLIVRVHAREGGWVFVLLMKVFAGIALLLYGMDVLSRGMRNAAGEQLRSVMIHLTGNRFVAVVAGVFVTILFQSSTATTVMLVGLVRAGIVRFAQTLGIILGADIGTTLTVQLIAFRLTEYSLLAVALGFAMLVFSKSERWRFGGEAVLGFGLLFFGMSMLSEGVAPIKSYEPFVAIVADMHSIIPAIIVGAIFTAVIHSSAAFIGIVIVFASEGVIDLNTGIALSLGANIGTCITAFIASFGSGLEAKRVAIAHTLFKLFGVLFLIAWIPIFSGLIESIAGPEASPARLLAHAHSIFNIGIAALFLPFINQFGAFIVRLVPDKGEVTSEEVGAGVADGMLLANPDLALEALKRDLMQRAQRVQELLRDALIPCLAPESAGGVHSRYFVEMEERFKKVESDVHSVRTHMNGVLARVVKANVAQEASSLVGLSNDLVSILSIIRLRLMPQVQRMRRSGRRFSDAGLSELRDYHIKTLKQMSRVLELLDAPTADPVEAQRIYQRFGKYKLLATELLQLHFKRLKAGIRESEQTSQYHFYLIASLLEISDVITNMARHMVNEVAEK